MYIYVYLNMFYVCKHSDLRPLAKLGGGGGGGDNCTCGGTTTGGLRDLSGTSAAASTLDDFTGSKSKLGNFLMSTLWLVRKYHE